MDTLTAEPTNNTELRQAVALLDDAPPARGLLVRDRYGHISGYIPGVILYRYSGGLAKFRPADGSSPMTVWAAEYREW